MSTNSTTLVARSLAEVPAVKCFRIKKVHGHGEIRHV